MKTIKWIAVLLVVFTLLLSALGGGATATKGAAEEVPMASNQGACTPDAMSKDNATQLVIGTGGKGGVFYPFGEGLAKILTANMPGVTTTFIETGGSVDNMKFILTGQAQIGFSTLDSAYGAIQGQAAYAETGKISACALAALYTNFMAVLVREAYWLPTV